MKQLNKLFEQAKKQMSQVQEQQSKLKSQAYEASSGGGMVTVTVAGALEVLSVKIAKECIDPSDPEMLQDLVRAAVNEALRKAQAEAEQSMSALTSGLNLPGL
jgi:DNA-binding YbaB/EbfC family protein